METTTTEPTRFDLADQTFGKIMKGFSYASAACLLVMSVWVTVNVIYSKTTGLSIPSTTDWVAYLLIPTVYMAVAAEIWDRGLVYVDMVTKRFPVIVEKLILFFSYLLGAVISVIIIWQQLGLTQDYFSTGKVSSIDRLHFPIWPFTLVLAVGLMLMTVAMVWFAIRVFMKKSERELEMENEEKEVIKISEVERAEQEGGDKE